MRMISYDLVDTITSRSLSQSSLAAGSRGSETESTDRRRAHHSCPKAAQTINCLIRTPFLRHLSRRVVRVEIGQKPGVVRGTGSSNPSPSGGESRANLRRVPSWLGIFAFRSSRGRVEGELSAQGTQFLKPCGGVTHNCSDADHLAGIVSKGHDSELDRNP